MKKIVIALSLLALAVAFVYAPYEAVLEGEVLAYGRRPLWDFLRMHRIDTTPWIVQIVIPAAFLAYGLFGMKDLNKSE